MQEAQLQEGDEVVETGALLIDERLFEDIETRIEFLAGLQDELRQAREELTTLHRLQKMIYVEPSADPTVDVVAELDLRTKLWQGFLKWQQFLEESAETPLLELMASDLQESSVTYKSLGVRLERELPANPVATDLKLRAKAASSWVQIVRALQNAKLKDRHRDELEAKLGVPLAGATLGAVLAAGALAKRQELASISNRATQED